MRRLLKVKRDRAGRAFGFSRMAEKGKMQTSDAGVRTTIYGICRSRDGDRLELQD